MSFEAVYEDGVFKPLGKVDLPDHQIVELQVVRAAANTPHDAESVWTRHGLKLLGDPPLSHEEFKELGPEWDPYLS